jgi:hypothetical protein
MWTRISDALYDAIKDSYLKSRFNSLDGKINKKNR